MRSTGLFKGPSDQPSTVLIKPMMTIRMPLDPAGCNLADDRADVETAAGAPVASAPPPTPPPRAPAIVLAIVPELQCFSAEPAMFPPTPRQSVGWCEETSF